MHQFSTSLDGPGRRCEDLAFQSLRATDPSARPELARLAGEVTDPGFPRAATRRASSNGDDRGDRLAIASLPDAWVRLWKRAQLPEQLIQFHDALAEAPSEAEICSVLARFAARIVGAYQALVLLAAPSDEDPETLRLAGWWSNGSPPSDVLLDRRAAQLAPSLIDTGAVETGEDAVGLAPLANTPGVATLATVPIGDQGLLLLSERRVERIFTPDDWTVLESLASHAERALGRVRALEEARSQALLDPLTGLANRRHMEIFLQHSWAAARRGEELAVMLLDLDDFKAINDRHGHASGDDVLRVVAEVLRTEARGSDAVIRYGGDEFLVVLPRAGAEAARRLYERVSRRLEGWVRASVGIAAYEPTHASPLALLQAADADLYARKRGRAGSTSLPAPAGC
jgi:diguanylate cyclase (GGDEF)-like protein